MSNKRKNYSPSFKAKVAMEAIKGDLTMSELSAKYQVHPSVITRWKQHAAKGLVDIFKEPGKNRKSSQDVQIQKLHAKIGQLTIERDFLAEISGQ
jgi:transposase